MVTLSPLVYTNRFCMLGEALPGCWVLAVILVISCYGKLQHYKRLDLGICPYICLERQSEKDLYCLIYVSEGLDYNKAIFKVGEY